MIHTKTRHIDVCIQANYGHHKYCNIPQHQHSHLQATCNPSLQWRRTIDSTATGDDGSNTPATMLSTLSTSVSTPIHADIVPLMWYLPYMTTPDATFLNHTLRLMRPLLITQSIFLILLYIFTPQTFVPTSMQQRYIIIFIPSPCSNLWFLLPCNKDNLILSL